MPIYHLHIFFGEVSAKVLAHFLDMKFVFLFLTFKIFLYILENSSLLDISFANISFQSVVCLSLLIVSYAEQKILILIKSDINYLFDVSCPWCISKNHCYT